MTRIRNRNGFRFISTLFICLVCFDVTIQRQISQGYPRSSYATVGHDGNGGRTVAHDGRPENVQPLRAGGEDPLRLRLVFMADMNQTTQSERPKRQEVHSLASHPSSMNIRVSDQYSPHGDIVRLDSQGILVAQKRRNRAPVPQRTSSNDAGRVPPYRTGSVVPSAPVARKAESHRDPPTAEARRYKEEAPIQRPVAHQSNARVPFRSRNIFKPLSSSSPGFSPLERLTDRARTVNTNPDPPWRPGRQRDPITQPRDRVYEHQEQPVAARNTGDPYGRPQSQPYPPRNDRYQTRPHVNEGTQARQLGNILSNMGHTSHDPSPLPSRHADSRPYPIQYTIPDSATPTEMRVRRVQQPEVARAQSRYVNHGTDRVRVRQEPATHYQDARQPVSNNAGSGISIPDNYSDRVRAPPQAPRDSGRFRNEQPQPQQTEVRAPSSTSAQTPRQPYQQPTTGLKPSGESPTNATGEMVVLSMQENADGTITYTVADRRKANVDRMNNVPVQVKKPTSAYSNSNVYDQPQQQHQSYPYNVDTHRNPSRSGANPQNPTVPTYSGSSYYSDYGPRAQSSQTFINEATRTLPTASQYDPYQREMVASGDSVRYSNQQAPQAQVQQHQGFDTQRYDTVRQREFSPYAAPQTQRYHFISKHDSRTQFNSGAATSSTNTEMQVSSVAREPVTYVHSVTSPTSEVTKTSVSSTEATKPIDGNYTIDDGVVYRITKGNNSVPMDIIQKHTDKLNTTDQAPFTARQKPAVNNPGEIRVEPSRPGNPRSYVLSENGGYAFRRGSVPANPNSGSVGQYPVAPSQVNSGYGSQRSPVGLSFQGTTPSSQPRSNLQVLKDIVKISGGKAIPSQVLSGRSNLARSSSLTQQRASPIRASSGNTLVETVKGITKLQALKTLECFPVTMSNNAYCQSSCLPYQNCVTAGNILFCCPPFVTETVVQFKMMQRTVEGMSDSL